MKTIFFFFALASSVAAIATQPEPRVYYTGNNELATSSADSVQLATVAPAPLERAGGEVLERAAEAALEPAPECPAYLTGNDEPVPFGRFIAE
ncbi:MAG: hypothetical protein LBF81_06000 [Prevotellaceae bacterium]|jgi:hypothetical protein|nr:hypothetical protein [Prevotellaceae bacterium]